MPRGRNDPAFRTKSQLAAALAGRAQVAAMPFRALVADCAYGDNAAFSAERWAARLPFVLALKPHQGSWAPADAAHTPIDTARELVWGGPHAPGAWTKVVRRFRDGRTTVWWVADAVLGGYGPHQAVRNGRPPAWTVYVISGYISAMRKMILSARALTGVLAALGLLVASASPAQASGLVWSIWTCGVHEWCPSPGTAYWSDDPSGSAPGDAIGACDPAADGWGVEVQLDVNRNGTVDRIATTRGHASPYCSPWATGDLPEGAPVRVRGCQVKGTQRACEDEWHNFTA
ncbi:transposase [Streptosporangium sp. NBC_01469]|uniref:transposase n=1 Tax=Streptosporangium sp. NBC_01469 TaxID=2903898 RepID=UPI003FCDB6D1